MGAPPLAHAAGRSLIGRVGGWKVEGGEGRMKPTGRQTVDYEDDATTVPDGLLPVVWQVCACGARLDCDDLAPL